jgi:hypothetical protein
MLVQNHISMTCKDSGEENMSNLKKIVYGKIQANIGSLQVNCQTSKTIIVFLLRDDYKNKIHIFIP